MGFDFGKVKSEDRSSAVINAARKAVDDALAEKFTAYLKSFYKGKWKGVNIIPFFYLGNLPDFGGGVF